MQNEIKALEDNKTCELVDFSKGKKFIGCRWVYKIKYHANGDLERLVAKGFNQKKGFDYQNTFCLVVKMTVVSSVISIAAARHWTIHQMNVYNSSLQGDLYEEVYMTLPDCFDRKAGSNKSCILSKFFVWFKIGLKIVKHQTYYHLENITFYS